jgi:radical SAM protein with 4Fe4S-binding SPASM domain
MRVSKNVSRKSYYGRAVLSDGLSVIPYRLKNRLLTAVQYHILNHFGNSRERSFYSRGFSNLTRKIVGPYIYSIKLEVNNVCNLNCEMCYIPKGQVNLSSELINRLFKWIRNKGIRIEILGGEPLLRKDIISILSKAKTYVNTPYLSLYTNGIHATRELSAEMKVAGLDAAIVTLISTDENIHDRFTGVKGSWLDTVKGISNLKEAGINTFTFTAIHSKNIHEADDIYRYVKEELNVHPLFYQYIPQRINDPLTVDPEEWYSVKNRILKLIPDHAIFVRDFFMLTGNACSGGNFVLTVKNDGSVQPCPFISDIPLGNIAEDNIWDIYRNRYKNTELHSFKKIPDECKGCTYVSVCGGGCRAGSSECNSYDRKDQRCLGPYYELLEKDKVIYRTPCFF